MATADMGTVTFIHTDPYRERNHRRIRDVVRVAQELYWEREPGATTLRTLDTHEGLFLSAVQSIQRDASKERAAAEREWGGDSQALQAIFSLSYSGEADRLEAALTSYRNECERREFGEVDEAVSLAAAE